MGESVQEYFIAYVILEILQNGSKLGVKALHAVGKSSYWVLLYKNKSCKIAFTHIEEQFHLYIVNTLEYGFRVRLVWDPSSTILSTYTLSLSKFICDGIKCNQYAFLSQIRIYSHPWILDSHICLPTQYIWMLNSVRHFTTNFIYPNPLHLRQWQLHHFSAWAKALGNAPTLHFLMRPNLSILHKLYTRPILSPDTSYSVPYFHL